MPSNPALQRSRLLAAAVCSLLMGAAVDAVGDEVAGHEAHRPSTLQSAKEALAVGDVAKATEIYEELSSAGESLDAELGLIRAALQGGEFRKAVSHASHTAAENRGSTEAAALLAFLLDRTGRTEQALSSLQSLEAQRPQDWIAIAAHAEILIDRLDARQALALIQTAFKDLPSQPPELLRLSTRARAVLAPQSKEDRSGNVPPPPIQSTWIATATQSLPIAPRDIAASGNGVVIDAGKVVLTDARLFLDSHGKAWVRNGVGKIRRATVENLDKLQNTVRLRLDEPFPAVAAVQFASPENTRFCFVFAFAVPGSLDPAFASITPGMVIRPDTGVGGLMQITSALGAGHNGAAVFDPRGRLLGMAIAAGDRELAKENIRDKLGNGNFAFRADRLAGADKTPAAAGPQPPMPSVEELYERLAPAVVQVIALK